MGFYSRHILPTVISCGCGMPMIADQRRKLVPRASGVVLELGMGAGHNLGFYDPARVSRVYGLEPDPGMLAKARRRVETAPVPVTLVPETAEALSLPDASVDTVLVTFAMCTIPDVVSALTGARRALRRGGRLFFCEHGCSPEPEVFRLQTRIEPVWKRVFGGCHLTRDIPALVRQAGFAIEDLDAGYMQEETRFGGGLAKIGGYLYRGSATAPA
jgi:ubiquinone/menaquinone biosynthesis C-methylase UbiE